LDYCKIAYLKLLLFGINEQEPLPPLSFHTDLGNRLTLSLLRRQPAVGINLSFSLDETLPNQNIHPDQLSLRRRPQAVGSNLSFSLDESFSKTNIHPDQLSLRRRPQAVGSNLSFSLDESFSKTNIHLDHLSLQRKPQALGSNLSFSLDESFSKTNIHLDHLSLQQKPQALGSNLSFSSLLPWGSTGQLITGSDDTITLTLAIHQIPGQASRPLPGSWWQRHSHGYRRSAIPFP